MSNSYRRRMLSIAKQLRSQRVSQYTSAPPVYRLCWMLGLRIRPPLYQSFASLTFFQGSWLGVLWGLLMWFSLWRNQGWRVTEAIITSVFAGLLFGLAMATYYRWKASRLKLPPIDDSMSA